MSELQKAVSEAERKAHEMISSERAKMERTVAEAKRQAAEDALIIINQQEDSSEVGCPTVFQSFFKLQPGSLFVGSSCLIRHRLCGQINGKKSVFASCVSFPLFGGEEFVFFPFNPKQASIQSASLHHYLVVFHQKI